jgi:putative transposase
MIVDYIDSQRERFGVEPVCAVLAEAGISIAPSTYYIRSKTPLTDVELDEAYMANQLRSLWQNNWGVYGPGSCGMRLAAPATTSAATRWPG